MSDGSLLFVGTATTVLRYAGFTLLTDPNFLHRGQRAYLGYGLTSRRLTEPALAPEQLPPLDAVLLSHLHGDHWDRRARRGLDRSVPILTTPHASRRLQGWHGFRRAVGLRTWESHSLVKDRAVLTVTALPARHAPGIAQRLLPPVMGSMLEFAPADGAAPLRVYVSGDTVNVAELRQIPARYPDVDLAVLHLGAPGCPAASSSRSTAAAAPTCSSRSIRGRRYRCTTTTTRCSPRRCRTSAARWSAAAWATGFATCSAARASPSPASVRGSRTVHEATQIA